MPDPYVSINVRLSPAAVRHVEAMAKAEDRTRSAMLRVLLSEALAAREGRKR